MDNNEQNQQQQRPPRTNEEFLKDSLKYLGFGDGLNQALDQNLATKQPSFSLDAMMLHGDKQMDFKLNFKQGKDGNRYFFNNFEATLSHTNANGAPVQKKQTFYIDKGKAFTAKEAFNLMDGRAVFRDDLSTKENVTYKAWVKLDLENPLPNGQHKPIMYGEDHGQKKFDLGTELSKFNIRELDNPDHKKWLINGLERGNLQLVNMVRGEAKVNDPADPTNKERVTFVAAEPRYKSINVYDENKRKLFVANNAPIKQDNTSTGLKTANPAQQQTTAQAAKQGTQAQKTEAPRQEKRKRLKM